MTNKNDTEADDTDQDADDESTGKAATADKE